MTNPALSLAREVVRLLDLWIATDGAQGAEDVSDAIAALSYTNEIAAELVAANKYARGGMTEERAGLWGAWRAGLLDSTPETFSDGTGIGTGLVWWSGFGSEARVRRAVGGAA